MYPVFCYVLAVTELILKGMTTLPNTLSSELSNNSYNMVLFWHKSTQNFKTIGLAALKIKNMWKEENARYLVNGVVLKKNVIVTHKTVSRSLALYL